jgi:hypothetical protein
LKKAEADLAHIDFVRVLPLKNTGNAFKKFIYIPGMSGTAEESTQMLEAFDGVESIAMSMRGRGRSTAPNSDFSFDAHVADIVSFLAKYAEPGYYLHSYSVSTAFALAALAHKACPKPAGLVIGDYPARYPKLSPGWASWFSTLCVGGRRTIDNLSIENMQAIERDSEDKDLAGLLSGFDFPVLVLKALGNTPAPSPISAADLAVYQKELKRCKIVEFESDHFFRDREREEYVQTLLDFMR